MPASSAESIHVLTPDSSLEPTEATSSFGKRFALQTFTLTAAHLEALQSGKILALDIQDEYIAHLRLDGNQ